MPAALPFIAAGAAVVGTVMQIQANQEASAARGRQQQAMEEQARAQERQFAAQQQRAEVQNVRSVRQQIRAQRMAAASIVGRGATTGTLGSSGVQGGVSSTGSQLAGNLSYMSNVADTQTAEGAAQIAQGQASLAYGQASGQLAEAQAMGQLGQTIFSAVGGTKAFSSAFPKNFA